MATKASGSPLLSTDEGFANLGNSIVAIANQYLDCFAVLNLVAKDVAKDCLSSARNFISCICELSQYIIDEKSRVVQAVEEGDATVFEEYLGTVLQKLEPCRDRVNFLVGAIRSKSRTNATVAGTKAQEIKEKCNHIEESLNAIADDITASHGDLLRAIEDKRVYSDIRVAKSSILQAVEKVTVQLKGLKEHCHPFVDAAPDELSQRLTTRYKDHHILEQAMTKGSVKYRVRTAVVQGEARAGKTSVKSLLLSQPYNSLSTTLIESPQVAVGNLSVNCFASHDKAATKHWTLVGDEEMHDIVKEELHSIAEKQPKTVESLTEKWNAKAGKDKRSIDSSLQARLPADMPDRGQPLGRERSNTEPQKVLDKAMQSVAKIQKKTTSQKEVFVTVRKFTEQTLEKRPDHDQMEKSGMHHDWLYFIDSGGQIQFQKLLPAFLPCASVLLLVVNLAKNLSDPSSTAMQLPDDQEIHVSEHSLKIEEILKQLLSAISSNANNYNSFFKSDPVLSKYITPPPENLNIITVATHRDEYDELLKKGKKIESLQDKETKLRQIFNRMGNTCEVVYKDQRQFKFFYEIDGRKAKRGEFDDPDVEQIEKKLDSNAYQIEVPLRWHCLRLVLCEKAKKECGVLKVSFCEDLGQEMEMERDEVIRALKFFHILNMLLYYPESPLNDVVFVSLDSLMDIIRELMLLICNRTNDWGMLQMLPPDVQQLVTEGVLTVEVLKRSDKYVEISKAIDDFGNKLLGLFKYLLIAVGLPEEGHFFMPALLPVKAVADTNPFPGTIPLLFYFKNSVPMGFFCTVIVRLVSAASSSWVLTRSSDNYSNHLILEKSGAKGSFVFVETLDCIEIYSDHPTSEVARDVERAIKEAFRRRNFNSAQEEGVKAFYCPCGVVQQKHVALVKGVKNASSVLRCSMTNKQVELPKTAEPWLANLNQKLNHRTLVELLADIDHKWYEFGTAVGIANNKLDGLRQNSQENIVRLTKILEYWRDGQGVPYDLYSLLSAVGKPPVDNRTKINDLCEHFGCEWSD